MGDVRERLALMDGLVAPDAAWTLSRRATCAALRELILEITSLRLRSGYSPELHSADVQLTQAISRYQFGMDDGSIETLRERLTAYRAAAMSDAFDHAPIEPLIEVALRPHAFLRRAA